MRPGGLAAASATTRSSNETGGCPSPACAATAPTDRSANWTASGLHRAAAVANATAACGSAAARGMPERGKPIFQRPRPSGPGQGQGQGPSQGQNTYGAIGRRCVPANAVVRIPRARDAPGMRPPFGAGGGVGVAPPPPPTGVPWDVRRVRVSVMFRVA